MLTHSCHFFVGDGRGGSKIFARELVADLRSLAQRVIFILRDFVA